MTRTSRESAPILSATFSARLDTWMLWWNVPGASSEMRLSAGRLKSDISMSVRTVVMPKMRSIRWIKNTEAIAVQIMMFTEPAISVW